MSDEAPEEILRQIRIPDKFQSRKNDFGHFALLPLEWVTKMTTTKTRAWITAWYLWHWALRLKKPGVKLLRKHHPLISRQTFRRGLEDLGAIGLISYTPQKGIAAYIEVSSVKTAPLS